MSVSAEVTEHLVRAAEGGLAVNDLTVPEKLSKKLPEDLSPSEALELSVKL
jgi:hypothetical protein